VRLTVTVNPAAADGILSMADRPELAAAKSIDDNQPANDRVKCTLRAGISGPCPSAQLWTVE
jgi:hypothetical protein